MVLCTVFSDNTSDFVLLYGWMVFSFITGDIATVNPGLKDIGEVTSRRRCNL
jgi:hypothetical protein